MESDIDEGKREDNACLDARCMLTGYLYKMATQKKVHTYGAIYVV